MALKSIGGTQPYSTAADLLKPAPVQPTSVQTAAPTPQTDGLDPTIVNVAKSIRQVESGGNFEAAGKSGEYGAYQFTEPTWNATASKIGITSPFNKATPQEQNAVAYHYIEDLKNQGYNVGQIASVWNSGKPDPTGNVGVNDKGVQYDTPGYVNKVYQAYQQFKAESEGGVVSPMQPTGPTNAITGDTSDPSLGGFAGNVVKSGANFAGNLINTVAHPLQTGQNLLETGAGALQELGGQSNDNTAKFDQLKNYFVQRYGGIDNLGHTLYSDPVGFAADLSTVLGGAEGVVGLAGRGAEIAGATGAASKIADVGNAIGKASELTNPLSPVATGASALLNKTKSLSDVIANPQNYSPEEMANAAPERVVSDVQTAIENARNGLSETGSGYTPFRETPTPIATQPDSIDSILRDSLKVDVVDGVIKQNSTSLLRDQASINKLQSVYNTYKSDFLAGTMDSEKLLNLRTDLAKIAYNDLGIKNTDVATLAAKVRSSINDAFREQVPGLSELDSKYSTQLNDLNDLQDGIIYKTGSNKGEIKTSFLNSAMKAVKNEDSGKLAQLEKILPGITKRLQIAKTLKDLGDPSFTTSLAEKGGLAAGFLTGDIKTMAVAAAAMILQKPAIAIPLMRTLGANMEFLKEVMANLAKTLTGGASLNNVQQSTPQTEGAQTTTTQPQETTASQTAQIGNPSLESLGASKGFDVDAALKAGYSEQDIRDYLVTV